MSGIVGCPRGVIEAGPGGAFEAGPAVFQARALLSKPARAVLSKWPDGWRFFRTSHGGSVAEPARPLFQTGGCLDGYPLGPARGLLVSLRWLREAVADREARQRDAGVQSR